MSSYHLHQHHPSIHHSDAVCVLCLLLLQVTEHALLMAPQLDNQALSNVCHSLARISYSNRGTITALTAALRPRLTSMIPQHLSNVIWALAILTSVPPAPWLAEFEAASAPLLDKFTPQGLANVIWAFAKLPHTPQSSWLQEFWVASEHQLKRCKPQELAQMLYSPAKLTLKPPDSWMSVYLDAGCEGGLMQSCPQELTMAIWSLAAFKYKPHKAWLMLFFLVSENSMATCSPQVSQLVTVQHTSRAS